MAPDAKVNTGQFVIEELQFVGDSLSAGSNEPNTGWIYYRITARALPGSNGNPVILQSTFARRQS
jgi:Tfp pilus assembly protein PilX